MKRAAMVGLALAIVGTSFLFAVGGLVTGIYYALDYQKGKQLYTEGLISKKKLDFFCGICQKPKVPS
jgi:hypothetical protein